MQLFIKAGFIFSMALVMFGSVLAQDDEQWVTFTSADEKLTFEHPQSWIIDEYPINEDTDFNLTLLITGFDGDEIFFAAQGSVINASKSQFSANAGPRLADNVTAVVDYESAYVRYRDNEPLPDWSDIEVMTLDSGAEMAYVHSTIDQLVYFFALELNNGNYFVLEHVTIYPEDEELFFSSLTSVFATMTYEQQTIYEDFDFPEPIQEASPNLWRINFERPISVYHTGIDNDDNIYLFHHFVVEEQPQLALVILNPDGQVIGFRSHPELGGRDVEIASDGTIWTTDGMLNHFTADGELLNTIVHAFDSNAYSQIDVDSENNIVALNIQNTPSVDIYSPEGELINSFDVPFAEANSGYYDGFAEADGLVPNLNVTQDQVIYVHSPNNGQVRAYDMDGNELETDLITALVSQFPFSEETLDFMSVTDGIRYFYYGADGLFYVLGGSTADDKPYGIYIYDSEGTELGYVSTNDVPLSGLYAEQFYVLSDGSVVMLTADDVIRREAIWE